MLFHEKIAIALLSSSLSQISWNKALEIDLNKIRDRLEYYVNVTN